MSTTTERTLRRLFGAPEPRSNPANPPTAEPALRTESLDVDQERLAAIGKLAHDVFEDYDAASAWVADPAAALQRAGLEGMSLELPTPEVGIAKALRHPRVREAAERADLDSFVQAIQEQALPGEDLLNPQTTFEVSALLSAFARASGAGPQGPPAP
jgi:hypothetical protein